MRFKFTSDSSAYSLDQQLINRLRCFLESTGLTQRQLSRLIGVDPSNLNGYIGGYKKLPVEPVTKLLQISNLSRSELEKKFTRNFAGRITSLQENGTQIHLSNDGRIAGVGPDPNDGDITDVNKSPARSVPDAAELEFLAGLAGLHQQIIDKISNWQAQKKPRPNPDGVTEPARRINDNTRSQTPGPKPAQFSRR
jgi:transcriptional regulator with XRE-family HTH domain